MSNQGLADQQDLLQWATSVPPRTEFPRLIRRLITETGGVARVDMPAGEGVSTGGWDGMVESYRESPYIPMGQSVWEISVRKDVNVKANSDYKKRAEDLDETISPEECTYVSVSLRRWADRNTWARERTKEGVWKKVEAYGVDDIEGWLETAPATHLWISEKLGLCPYGRRSATSWWDGWAAATTPPTPSSFVIAGREEQVTQLNELLTAEPQIITIGGTSVHETYAFIAALVSRDPDRAT